MQRAFFGEDPAAQHQVLMHRGAVQRGRIGKLALLESQVRVQQLGPLAAQLDDLTDSVNGTGSSIVARGEEALEETLRSARELIAKYGDTAKSTGQDTANLKTKATDTLIEHTEARPLTTLAAIIGIGFLAGWLCRRN